MNATSSGNGPVHARFDGPIVMVGFGSIGNGTLPLIERHIALDRAKFVVIAPDVASPSLRAGPTIANEFRNLVK